ncbi:MAG TPA: CDP-2,3-bis-(O-geranylgeranyl)-sn-glycerol synthase [Methanosarcina sp.]
MKAFWLMLPAYLPNPFAAVFGGGKPIDGGRTLRDGRRIIGDGKTYKGLFSGIFFGVLAGSIQIWLSSRGFEILGIGVPAFGPNYTYAFKVVFALACGSLFGDMFKSFFKRRMGMKRGAPLPLVDQLDFVIGAWVFAYLTAPEWFVSNFTPSIMIIILITTPLLHLTTNIIGYFTGIKKEPW